MGPCPALGLKLRLPDRAGALRRYGFCHILATDGPALRHGLRACSRSFHSARKAAKSRNLGARRRPCWRPGQGAQRRVRLFAALPEGLPRKGSVCGVANPRRATSPAAVCALQPLPLRGNGLHEKIVNTF